MNWLSFIAEIIKALAWPAVVIVFILLFKVPLAQVIASFVGRPLKAKVAGNEIEVGVKEAMALGEDLPPPEEKQLIRYIQKAPTSPRKAMVESWQQLQSAAASVFDEKPTESSFDVAVALKGSGVLDYNKFKLFAQLKALGEKATSLPEYELSTNTAMDYAEVANRLAKYIADRTATNKDSGAGRE